MHLTVIEALATTILIITALAITTTIMLITIALTTIILITTIALMAICFLKDFMYLPTFTYPAYLYYLGIFTEFP